MIMHPDPFQLDGQILDKASFNKARALYAADGRGQESLDQANLFQSFVRVVGKHGDGFVAYEWPKPNKDGGVSQNLYPKLSYVKAFDAWGWIVGGTGVYRRSGRSLLENGLAGRRFYARRFGAHFCRRHVGAAENSQRVGRRSRRGRAGAQRIASGDLVTVVGTAAVPVGSMLAALEGMRVQLELLARPLSKMRACYRAI